MRILKESLSNLRNKQDPFWGRIGWREFYSLQGKYSLQSCIRFHLHSGA
jgi:hypothetical protein